MQATLKVNRSLGVGGASSFCMVGTIKKGNKGNYHWVSSGCSSISTCYKATVSPVQQQWEILQSCTKPPIWCCSNGGLFSPHHEQILLGVWLFYLTHFLNFLSVAFGRVVIILQFSYWNCCNSSSLEVITVCDFLGASWSIRFIVSCGPFY